MVYITSEEQNKVKTIKITKNRFIDLWANIKHSNIWIIADPEEEEKKNGYEKIFEEIIVWNFCNIEKEIVSEVEEVQSIPYRVNSRRKMPRHILIKLIETKQKERILKGDIWTESGRMKKYISCKWEAKEKWSSNPHIGQNRP